MMTPHSESEESKFDPFLRADTRLERMFDLSHFGNEVVDFDPQLFCRKMFAISVVARLHELNHATAQTLARRPHHQPKRAGRLAFAVAGVNDEKPASLFLIISATPFVFLFLDGHF